MKSLLKRALVLCLLLSAFTAATNAQHINMGGLDSLVNSYTRLDYAGNVLIAHGDTIIYQRTYGLADRERNKPVSRESLFMIESLGKMMTAVMILQLYELKKIDLNTTIDAYLSDTLYGLPAKNKVTIHHLLTHAAGYEESPVKTPSARQMSNVKLAFEPGTNALYSNFGYKVLGEVIARVTGKSYEQNLQERILKPAGITDFYAEIPDTLRMALPYKNFSQKKYILVKSRTGNAGAAGGWVTKIEELFKFYRAYHNNIYISAATKEIMRTANHTVNPAPRTRELFTYGQNWLPSGYVGDYLIYGHSGGGLVYSSALYFDPASDYAVITLSNTYQKSRLPVANFFNMLNGRPLVPVEYSPEFRLMTLIDEIGIDSFELHHKEYLIKTLGTEKPDVFAFTSLIDNYSDLHEYPMILRIATLCQQLYPDNGVWYYFKGDAYFNMADHAAARHELQQLYALLDKSENLVLKRYADELNAKLNVASAK
jgi:CubicO group peptidase (beta-lactamase class C family)